MGHAFGKKAVEGGVKPNGAICQRVGPGDIEPGLNHQFRPVIGRKQAPPLDQKGVFIL